MTALTLYETLGADGAREPIDLLVDDGVLVVRASGVESALPMDVLLRVMARYGKPLDEGVALDGPSLDLGDGRTLWRIRHRGFYDVIARDFVVLEAPGAEPLCEMATAVSAALLHFARAARPE